jgi:hypothetical protein
VAEIRVDQAAFGPRDRLAQCSIADPLLFLELREQGDRYVKVLHKKPLRNHYNLRSFNVTNKDIEAVRLAWAAPIEWIKRGNHLNGQADQK